jgi:hypothetical protein
VQQKETAEEYLERREVKVESREEPFFPLSTLHLLLSRYSSVRVKWCGKSAPRRW